MDLPPDPTLDEMRAALAPLIARNAAFDGWGDAALVAAAGELGLPVEQARLAYPDGAAGMIDAWFAQIDARLAADFPPDRIAAMKIRDRITALVRQRIEIAMPQRDALQRALAILAQPQNIARGVKLGWRSADTMWRIAGDTATDFAHYTKRVTLAGVYGATLLAFLDDESEGHTETWAFLDRRIEGVMRFEKLKQQIKGQPGHRLSLSRFLGRLRYPAT